MQPQSRVLIQRGAVAVGKAEVRIGAVWRYALAVKGTGAVSASASVEVSDDQEVWYPFGTLTASGTTIASDPAPISGNAPWTYHRASITAISGTGAVATVTGAGV